MNEIESSLLKIDCCKDWTNAIGFMLSPIPYLSDLKSALNDKLTSDRLTLLITQLAARNIELDFASSNDELIHAVRIVCLSVIQTHQKEKIIAYSQLLGCSIEDCRVGIKIDELEFYKELLDTLTYSEMLILESLYRIDSELVWVEEDGHIAAEELRTFEMKHLSTEMMMSLEILENILFKLASTGLIDRIYITSFSFGANAVKTFYKITPLYRELRLKIYDLKNV